jgi:hypothetical protein
MRKTVFPFCPTADNRLRGRSRQSTPLPVCCNVARYTTQHTYAAIHLTCAIVLPQLRRRTTVAKQRAINLRHGCIRPLITSCSAPTGHDSSQAAAAHPAAPRTPQRQRPAATPQKPAAKQASAGHMRCPHQSEEACCWPTPSCSAPARRTSTRQQYCCWRTTRSELPATSKRLLHAAW